jgi:hypothetical protein
MNIHVYNDNNDNDDIFNESINSILSLITNLQSQKYKCARFSSSVLIYFHVNTEIIKQVNQFLRISLCLIYIISLVFLDKFRMEISEV